MSNDYELPPMPQAVDVTPVSWSNLFSADQMREYALLAVQQERERCARICDAVYADEQDEPVCYGFAKECAAAIRKG
jgi:hypothetical protein